MRWLFRLLALSTLLWAGNVFAQTGIGYQSTLGSQGVTPVSPTTPLPTYAAPSSGAGLTPSPVAPSLATSQVIKASAGNLYSFEVSADSTLSAAAWWILIFDSASDPGNVAVTPRKCYAQPAGVTSAAYAWTVPVAFTTGIVIVVSSTGCYTETQSAHAFISGDAK